MKDIPPKIYIIGLNYSLKFYMNLHLKILNQFSIVEKNSIEDIIPNYNRRSFFTLITDFTSIFLWLKKNKPKFVITVGPKVGFLFAISSFFFDFKLIHWFTGQTWALDKIKIISPAYIADFFINLKAYKTISDSKEQSYFLENNFFKKKVLYHDFGSINCVSQELLEIGSNRIMKINSPNFQYNLPIRVGFLGRICLEKGLATIKSLSDDEFLIDKFKFVVRGPFDKYISKSRNKKPLDCYDFLYSAENIDFKEGFIQKESFFKSIDIFIFPSTREGFGSVALEAQACGIPVICSNIYGLYSSVIEGYGGIHCNNLAEYKSALFSFLELSNYIFFCNNAYAFSKNYTEKVFSQNLKKIYNSIIY